MAKIKIGFVLNFENIEELDKIAIAEKLSRSWLIRRAVYDFVKTYNSTGLKIKQEKISK